MDQATLPDLLPYAKYNNPDVTPVPVNILPGSVHKSGPSRVIPFDQSAEYGGLHCSFHVSRCGAGTSYKATSPNLLANFVRVVAGESLETKAVASSQALFIIRGSGYTLTDFGKVEWNAGDLFVLPGTEQSITHHAHTSSTEHGGAALFWWHDEPLLKYLGAGPITATFTPKFFSKAILVEAVEKLAKDPASKDSNRIGVLPVTNLKHNPTKTLTHTLWGLFQVVPAHSSMLPHKHSSVALDLAITAKEGAYTLMAREIDDNGNLIDPVRIDWNSEATFITPPGWWHSHINGSDEDAWLFPVQDAGLYTYQRTLDIRFWPGEKGLKLHRGATFKGSNIKHAS